MAKGDPKNSGAYGAMDIGNYAGSQGPQQFQSMYPNLNMPQSVASGQRVGSPNMYSPNATQGIQSMFGQQQPQQLPSMQPQQQMMPDFLQLAMARYMGNQQNAMPSMQNGMQALPQTRMMMPSISPTYEGMQNPENVKKPGISYTS